MSMCVCACVRVCVCGVCLAPNLAYAMYSRKVSGSIRCSCTGGCNVIASITAVAEEKQTSHLVAIQLLWLFFFVIFGISLSDF